MRIIRRVSKNVGWLALAISTPLVATGQELRLAIIGTDTSHATAFTKVLNDGQDPEHIPGARVVAAWKGGSPDIEESAKRIDQYAAELHDKGALTDAPAEMALA